ncbi:hypothetical protein N7495_000584 [Penicillium taxi]|uniref:uncharacterized protein n=1 Tax=Penicillium taxi TaxID=168475 RepID=UPI002545AE44|nr:uncharacterized protein N7495_000584 [Penicillium taxi]KAJ5907902.1 hypothetical protein N7495_000584 [Penicillium taxi]
MAPPNIVRAPTTASLPNNLRIPSTTPSLIKNLSRLSRQALLELALTWLNDDRGTILFPPYLQREGEGDDEEIVPYPAAETVEEVREEYEDLQERKGGKREVLERILEGDWRHGITLRQLAMADIRYMDDHPTGLRWTALELRRIDTRHDKSKLEDWSASFPRIQAATFIKALQKEVAPLVKAHYHIVRSSSLPITFLRIFVVDSPYNSPRQTPEIFADSSRVMYVAFPDSSPHVYTSISASIGKATAPKGSVATDPRSLQRIVRDAIPKALSRPHDRYSLNATGLTAKHLPTLLALRGPGRSTAANGAFSIFADAALEGSPLDPRLSNTVPAEEHARKSLNHAGESPENAINLEEPLNHKYFKAKRLFSDQDAGSLSPTSKKRKLAVSSRFGSSMTPAPLDRLDIRFLDKPTVSEEEDDDENGSVGLSLPTLSLSFTGSDVISGIRKLAEIGIVDPERMPSWMTGEDGVSTAAVRGGRRVKKTG